jgi:amino acid adenylation domain-containing protein
MRTDQQKGFDLEKPPLMRLALFRLAGQTSHLIWTYHHALLDGWAAALIEREVFSYYTGTSGGRDVEREIPRPFRDYITWLNLQDLPAAETFWRETLRGFAAPTPLGIDRACGSAETLQGDYRDREIRLPKDLTTDLNAFAQQHSLTLSSIVQGSWGLLLSRYSGHRDVAWGVTLSGRPPDLVGSGAMIGLFINTLPVRIQIPPSASILSWLQSLQARLVALRQYDYSPLIQVHGWSDVPRGSSLFESIIVFENYVSGESASSKSPLGIELIGSHYHSRVNYPLMLLVLPQQELYVRITYDRHRFAGAAIDRLAGHLQTVLAGFVADPDRPLRDLPILTGGERQALLAEWNDTSIPYPKNECVHGRFQTQARQTPDATAVVFEEHHLTYHELDRCTDQLARHILSLSDHARPRVGVCMERSLDMVIALYSTLKAGAAYVPLDPTYPPERLAFMLNDAQAAVLLTQQRLASAFSTPHSALCIPVVCLDARWGKGSRQTGSAPGGSVFSDDVAYVIYTSGSTGKPKGAMNTHAGIYNRLVWMQDCFQIDNSDRVLQKTPFGFDVSVWEFFWPLMVGAALVVARPEGHKDSAYLVKMITDHSITTIHFVPSMLQVFCQDRNVAACRSLRRVVCSGEALPFDLQQRFFARLQCPLYNLYGPTEASIDVTHWHCRKDAEHPIVPIGRPIANTRIYILDPRYHPVPIGVPGELYVGGVGLASGYLSRPALTARRFIPDPFSRQPGARLYKTGDLARFLKDGSIEFAGRVDFQVKIRGQRIELGEIEAALTANPAVREAVVLARQDKPHDPAHSAGPDKRLVAYVVASDGHRPTTSDLRAALQQRLPAHMLPSAFILLDALPLTGNGKIDRRALPTPEGTRPQLDTVFISPRSEAERTIAQIWQDVLDVDQVGIHDSFFDLGGHSLLAIQVLNRLSVAFRRDISLTDLFKYTDVASLARFFAQDDESEPSVVHSVQQRAADRLRSRRQRRPAGQSRGTHGEQTS